jgi:hypothetical protein
MTRPSDLESVPDRDLLGAPLTKRERELCQLYLDLKRLADDDDLPPCALMNVKQAMVMLWNACVDLDLVFEEPGSD